LDLITLQPASPSIRKAVKPVKLKATAQSQEEYELCDNVMQSQNS